MCRLTNHRLSEVHRYNVAIMGKAWSWSGGGLPEYNLVVALMVVPVAMDMMEVVGSGGSSM